MIITGQLAVSSATPALLCRVPPGVCNVTLANRGSSFATITQSTAATTNGYVLGAGQAPTTFNNYSASSGVPLYVAGTATVSYLIVTDS